MTQTNLEGAGTATTRDHAKGIGTQANAMLADVKARVAAAVAAREAAAKGATEADSSPAKPTVTPTRAKVLGGGSRTPRLCTAGVSRHLHMVAST